MAGSLRDHAMFLDADVVSAFQQPLTPEQVVLDHYVFLPHARTGIAAAITTPFSWTGPPQAAVEMRVPVVDDRGGLDAEMTVQLFGPASVVEIDQVQVVRTFPKAGVANAEVDDLVHVEFDRPDLPWLFTPAGPDAQQRLVPWVTLVVAERRHLAFGERRGTVRRASVRRDQLQPLGDAWAWAHAQVMGRKGDDAAAVPTLEQRLGEANAAHNLSRLVCPRRLDDHTAYVACVVPTFEAGRRAGLGITDPVDTLAPAWGTPADFGAGDPEAVVELPVYFSWSFATGEEGNFESLASQLMPRVAPPGVGRRRVDTTTPWGVEPVVAQDGNGAEVVVEGPVVSPQTPDPDDGWPPEERQRWDPPVQAELVAKLDNAEARAQEGDPPVVGPPLYGGHHAQQRRLEDGQPAWFEQLNTDPRDRIVGGVATTVVQAEQEPLMQSAWNQVVGVEEANRALRLAQLAKHVSRRLHARHLERLPEARLLAVTDRVHAKLLDAPERSIWATLDGSTLPHAVTLGAFRRVTRVRGPVVRAAMAAPAAEQRAEVVEGLTVRPDHLTTDWVLRHRQPDAVAGVDPRIRKRLTREVLDRVAPGTGPDELLGSWNDDLARPGPVEGFDRVGEIDEGQPLAVGGATWAGVTRRLLTTMPDREQMHAGADQALSAGSAGTLLYALVRHAAHEGYDGVDLPVRVARRLALEGDLRDDRTVFVDLDQLARLGDEAAGAPYQFTDHVPSELYERLAGRIVEGLRGSLVEGPQAAEGLRAVAARLVGEDRFPDRGRERVDVPALGLVAKLDPRLTVPARVHGRLTQGSGRLPSWLRPDWFDDLRVEPVMAHPRFRWPMYEPLHRHHEEWMVAGLGLIERPDMATLLQTNNRFIEGYLVGLNHEMGRELLWREYPTDQRGTYFDSFWTGRPELVADLHEPPWRSGPLGGHLEGADKRLVFLVRGDLVRRYPGVVAHAAREAAVDPETRTPVLEATPPVETLFHAFLAPNVLLVGFDMDAARVRRAGETWWFALSENPSEPRFGLDPSRDGPMTRDELVWTDFGVTSPGQFLDATTHTHLAFGDNRWGGSSAQVAALLFQLPARALFNGRRMLDGAGG
jgi:hypothetical protein